MSSWPRVRLRTPTKGDSFRAVDQVQIQDAIIGGKHGDKTIVLGSEQMIGGPGVSPVASQQGPDGGLDWAVTSNGDRVFLPLSLPANAVITGFRVRGSGAFPISGASEGAHSSDEIALFRKQGVSGFPFPVVTKSVPTDINAWTLTFDETDTGLPHAVVADFVYYLCFKKNDNTGIYYFAQVDLDFYNP